MKKLARGYWQSAQNSSSRQPQPLHTAHGSYFLGLVWVKVRVRAAAPDASYETELCLHGAILKETLSGGLFVYMYKQGKMFH
jgi:hypothetical protein